MDSEELYHQTEATTRDKLQLIRQIRSEYNRNQNDLIHREQILYGHTMDADAAYYEDSRSNTGVGGDKFLSLKLRFAGAVFLLTLLILSDLTGKKIASLSIETIKVSIEKDYEAKIVSWITQYFTEHGFSY